MYAFNGSGFTDLSHGFLQVGQLSADPEIVWLALGNDAVAQSSSYVNVGAPFTQSPLSLRSF